MNETNINIDAQTLEQCLKSVSHFGKTEYINICTGTSNVIPWGNLDWFGITLLCVIGLGSAALVATLLCKIVFDS